MKKPDSDSGFTMVELAITLGLLGIVAAVAIPSLSEWQGSYALRSAGQEVYAMLMLAKTEAMRRNHNCVVQFINPNRVHICDRNCNLPTNVIQESVLPSGVTFGGGPVGNQCQIPLGASITFGADSVPRTPGGSIYLIISQRQSCVAINNAGNIAIY